MRPSQNSGKTLAKNLHDFYCMKQKSAQERFWAKVDIRNSEECWPWLAYKNRTGYGVFAEVASGPPEQKVYTLAHRYAYRDAIGTIPENHFICHKCDNPPCCNPNHLFAGTAKENAQDARSKGRVPKCRVGHATLDRFKVLKIVEMHKQNIDRTEIAKRFGVKERTIRSIVNGERWTHVTNLQKRRGSA